MESSIIVTVITSITIFDGTNINDNGANNKNIDDNNSTIMIKIIIVGNLATIKMITMITTPHVSGGDQYLEDILNFYSYLLIQSRNGFWLKNKS